MEWWIMGMLVLACATGLVVGIEIGRLMGWKEAEKVFNPPRQPTTPAAVAEKKRPRVVTPEERKWHRFLLKNPEARKLRFDSIRARFKQTQETFRV